MGWKIWIQYCFAHLVKNFNRNSLFRTFEKLIIVISWIMLISKNAIIFLQYPRRRSHSPTSETSRSRQGPFQIPQRAVLETVEGKGISYIWKILKKKNLRMSAWFLCLDMRLPMERHKWSLRRWKSTLIARNIILSIVDGIFYLLGISYILIYLFLSIQAGRPRCVLFNREKTPRSDISS